jgi:hypothetical protein
VIKRNTRYERMKTKSCLFFRSLSPQVKNMFKKVSVGRGDTMQDVIEALMRLYIKKPEIVEAELKTVKKSRIKDIIL